MIEVLLELLADLVHPRAGNAKLPGQAGRTLALGNPTQHQDDLRRSLARLLEDGASQDGVVAAAGLAPISSPDTIYAIALVHVAPSGAAPRALQALGVQMPFKPLLTFVFIEEFADGEIDHGAILHTLQSKRS